jgi:hypothetical protein
MNCSLANETPHAGRRSCASYHIVFDGLPGIVTEAMRKTIRQACGHVALTNVTSVRSLARRPLLGFA